MQNGLDLIDCLRVPFADDGYFFGGARDQSGGLQLTEAFHGGGHPAQYCQGRNVNRDDIVREVIQPR